MLLLIDGAAATALRKVLVWGHCTVSFLRAMRFSAIEAMTICSTLFFFFFLEYEVAFRRKATIQKGMFFFFFSLLLRLFEQ